MAKKRNQSLRPDRDHFQRKKANGRNGWEKQMMKQLKTTAQAEEGKTTKRKGTRDNAKRITGDSL